MTFRIIRGAHLVVAIATLLAAATPAAGQFGIRGGANLSKFVGSGATGAESQKGLNGGGTMPLIHIGPVSIVPEVYYAQKGTKLGPSALTPPPSGTTPTTIEFGLDYIEVPLLAKVRFPLAQKLHGYVTGGPAYAWNVNCSISTDTNGTESAASDCGETFGSFKTAMQKADRGVVGGGGLDFIVPGFGGINLDLRVVRGLTRLTTGSTGADVKNQSVSLMLGYYLGAGR